MPFFSIIVPVYNVAPYLRECLDSILAQSFENWEAVCVDDGSSDGGWAILEQYSALDKRFRIFRQENSGVSAARNRGLDEARGEWIWFVDSDDIVHPDSLGHISHVVQDCPDVDAYSFRKILDGEKAPREWDPLAPSAYSVVAEHGPREFHQFVYAVCTSIFRRTSFPHARFSNHAFGEDTLFCTALFLKAHAFAVDLVALYFRRVRPESATGKPSLAMARGYIEAMTELVALLGPHIETWSLSERGTWKFRKVFLSGHKECFLRISNQERKKLLGPWLALQRQTLALRVAWRYTGPAVAVLRLLPSGRLARLLVSGVLRAKDRPPLRLVRDFFVVAGRAMAGRRPGVG